MRKLQRTYLAMGKSSCVRGKALISTKSEKNEENPRVYGEYWYAASSLSSPSEVSPCVRGYRTPTKEIDVMAGSIPIYIYGAIV